jgi:hypothetical protein
MAAGANVYYLIDDYASSSVSGVGTGGGSGLPVSHQFTAASLALAKDMAFGWATFFNRPCRLVPLTGTPPYTLFTPGASAAPTTVTVLTGTISVTNGSGAVVGTSTLFTTQLNVGSQVVVANQLGTVYTVSAIADATHCTLTPVFGGTTNASTTMQLAPSVLFTSAGTVSVTNASAAVVGTSTTFTTSLVVGQNVQIGNQLGTNYTVATITDNTHLTLTANFGGSTNASTTLLYNNVGY